jgi:hypothetical protein
MHGRHMSAYRDFKGQSEGNNNSSGSGQGLGVGSCGHGSEPSSIITCRAFLRQLSTY